MFCKLKNGEMDVGECFDIQMVRNGYIKPELFPTHLSFENADSVCTFCKYNQLPQEHELTDVLYYIKNTLPYPSQINRHGFSIHFHDGFIFEYAWNSQNPRINGKPFYQIELADLEDWLRQFAGGNDVIIQYKKAVPSQNSFSLG